MPTTYEHWERIPDSARSPLAQDTRGITALKDGQISAVCLLDNWTLNSCIGHLWIDDPIVTRRGFLEEICGFVFGSGREVILGFVPSDNEKALKFNAHLGFKELFRIKDGYKRGVDIVAIELRKSNCRYI